MNVINASTDMNAQTTHHRRDTVGDTELTKVTVLT